jgi:DNA repair protein RadC
MKSKIHEILKPANQDYLLNNAEVASVDAEKDCEELPLEKSFFNEEQEDNEQQPPHYLGHRVRLKERFLQSSRQVADYELLELLLFAAIPRKDVKPIAKSLLSTFGSLNAVLYSDLDKLKKFPGVNKNTCLNILMIREFIDRILKNKILNKNIISSWNSLLDYLKSSMGSIKIEQFRVLFLNKKNILIADEIMSVGTIDQTPVYPREIIKKALFHEAGAIILVHNHPSGVTKPSKADLELTARISEACTSMNITLHDHVIIAGNEYFSFKSNLIL